MKAAFIGAGLRGRLFATLMSRHPDVELAGAFDPSVGSRQAFEQELGGRTFADLDTMLATRPDVVVIATPDHLHLDVTLAAVRAGAAILVEKPLASSADDARRIRDAVVAGGNQLMVACLNRWHPAFARVLAEAAAGRYGRILFQNARLSNSIRVPQSMLSWAEHSSPGWFLMPHSVDLVAAMAPAGPATVRATGRRGLLSSKGIDTWDGLQAVIEFTGGTSALVESLWTLPEQLPAPVRFALEVVGEAATAVVDDSDQGLAVLGEGVELPRVLVGDVAGRPAGPNALMVDAFLDAVRSGVSCQPDVHHGLWVTQIIDAIHESAQTGRDLTVRPG